MADSIGFIGLGNMGAPMAANLLKAGHRVTGYDLNPAALAALAAAGGSAAASAAEAARGAEIVITMLPAGEHVREVWLHQGGLIEAAQRRPEAAADRLLHHRCRKRAHGRRSGRADAGLEMLDAPVSGGTVGAAAGTLTFMVGGSGGGLRARPADPAGDGQEHLPRRRTGRRPGGEDLQQHDAGDQHGRRQRGLPAGAKARPGLGQAACRSPRPRPASPGR